MPLVASFSEVDAKAVEETPSKGGRPKKKDADAASRGAISLQTAPRLPVAAPGRYLLDPNGAVIRARAIDQISSQAWLLHPGVAYLSSDVPIRTPFASCFEVLQILDFNPKVLRAWVRTDRVGVLEIKKRAVDIDPAQLRRSLKPSGPNAATLIVARTTAGTKALVCRRS